MKPRAHVASHLTAGGQHGDLRWPFVVSIALGVACSANEHGNASTPSGSSGGSTGVPVSASGASGAVGAAPIVAANGGNPGVITIGPSGGTGGASVTLVPDAGVSSARTPISIDACGAANPAGLSSADAQKLMAGAASGNMRWLYPYDATVFPRGLKAAELMWDDGTTVAPTAVYVHVHSSLFDYRGCLKPDGPGQVQLPQDVWDAAGTRTLGAADPFQVDLTTLAGGTAAGPITEHLVLAQATISGSIYYNTYNSSNGSGLGGAIERIVPGQDAAFFVRPAACTGCHSVSSEGTRLVARELTSGDGQVYDLTSSAAVGPDPARAATSSSFVGLSPDGSVYVSNGSRSGVGPPSLGGVPNFGDVDATMYETDTGTVVTDTGVPPTAMMLTFSPDATHVVFNDYAMGQGHGLSLMTYDKASRKATSYKQLYTDAKDYLGWPFLFPDNQAVVFAAGTSTVFTGDGVGILPTGVGPDDDLWIVDVASGSATLLYQAMGFKTAQDAASNTTYLPFGAEELHRVYYPTLSPVPAGGYVWVFFDAMRHYGNRGLVRQLWGTALTLSPDGKYATDPSHPAFYLAGQSLTSANHRAFLALDPCKQDGAACETGVDCCNGFCTNHVCGKPSEPRCSQTSEACKASGDCCDPRQQCINGFCAIFLQ